MTYCKFTRIARVSCGYARGVADRNSVAITLAVPLSLTQWWSMQFNGIGTWQRQNITYDGDRIGIEQRNYRISLSQNFSLPKEYALELSGFYQSAGLVGFTILKPFGALNFGAKKKQKGNRGALRFNVTDIFNTNKIRGSVNLPQHNLVTYRMNHFVTRTARLTYSRNFGSSKVKGAKGRLTGSDEERKRVE